MAAMATPMSSRLWIIVVVLVAMLLSKNFAAILPEGPTWTIGPRHDPPTTVSCWLGFAFNSTLGYPGEGPPTLEFDEGTELWLQHLEEETRLIKALPCVQQVKLYDHDSDPNLNYIQATLWCCWQSGRFKQMKEATDQTGNKPTHVEAARALRGKIIEKHAYPGHAFDHRAIARRATLKANQEATPEATTFDRIRLAQARQLAATRAASAAEQLAEAAREADVAARLARSKAELQAKALRAVADALKPKEPSHKKQKTAFSAGSSSQQAQQTDVCEPALDDDDEPTLNDDDEPTYKTWSAPKWKELETKEQQRRNRPIDPARACTPSVLPACPHTRTHTHMHTFTAHVHCTRTLSLFVRCTPQTQLTSCIGCLLTDQHGSRPARWRQEARLAQALAARPVRCDRRVGRRLAGRNHLHARGVRGPFQSRRSGRQAAWPCAVRGGRRAG